MADRRLQTLRWALEELGEGLWAVGGEVPILPIEFGPSVRGLRSLRFGIALSI